MRIAIVGATGMLGHHTALAAVAAGHDVTVVYRSERSLARLSDFTYERAKADLDDEAAMTEALRGCEAAINCAAYYPTTPKPWRQEVETALGQMRKFYAACHGADLRRIVYLGGAIALRRAPEGELADETHVYEGRPSHPNPYLQVKWALDDQAIRRAEEGLPVVVGIPLMSFGELDAGNSTGRLILELANGRLPGYVRGKRNVVYAGDAGRGLVLACERGRPGERYLFAGENVTMDDLMQRIATACGRPMPKAIPAAVAKIVSKVQGLRYRFLAGPEPTVSETAIAVMSAGQFVDGSKAERELSFRAEVSTDEAIARALKWFRDQGMIDSAT